MRGSCGDRVRGPIAGWGGEGQESALPLSALGKEPPPRADRSSRPALCAHPHLSLPICTEVSQGLHSSLSFSQQSPRVFLYVPLSPLPPLWTYLQELSLSPCLLPQCPPLAATRGAPSRGMTKKSFPRAVPGMTTSLQLAEQTAPAGWDPPSCGAAGSQGPSDMHMNRRTHPYLGRRAADGARWGRDWGCPRGAGGPPRGSRWPRLKGPCWGTEGTTLAVEPPSGPTAGCSLLSCRQACHL